MSSSNSSSTGDKSNGKSNSKTQKAEQEVTSNDVAKEEEPFVVKALKPSKDNDKTTTNSAEVVEEKTEKKSESEGWCFCTNYSTQNHNTL